jgi:hypothetical protein
VAKRTNAERVDKWVALVDAIENCFATDVRKTEAVAVERDSADYSVHNSCGVRVLNCSEAKLIRKLPSTPLLESPNPILNSDSTAH